MKQLKLFKISLYMVINSILPVILYQFCVSKKIKTHCVQLEEVDHLSLREDEAMEAYKSTWEIRAGSTRLDLSRVQARVHNGTISISTVRRRLTVLFLDESFKSSVGRKNKRKIH